MSSPSPKDTKPILVSRSVPPPMEAYAAHLQEIWASRHFTNAGPKHAALKKELCHYLGLPDCVLMSNCTVALVAALYAFDLGEGEVITTPYTFVASSQCLLPARLTPRFVDIEPEGLTIDPAQIEAAITDKTKAILGVHVYGNPCLVDEIDAIAKKHNLKVIYDAAHAFGVEYHGQSVFNYGDASCLSFHATKAFHTFEGGAVVSTDPAVCDYIRRYRNFGIQPDGQIVHHGLNTKMSEVHAAAGLCNLPLYESHTKSRKAVYERYREMLGSVPGLRFVSYDRQEKPNYNYCPVLFDRGRDELFDTLAKAGIFTRKYFHPLVTDMPAFSAYRQDFRVASDIVSRVLCLPLYPDMTVEEQDQVISVVRSVT